MRKTLVAFVVLSLVGVPAAAFGVVHPAFRPGHVRVSPASGAPNTTFTISFKAPEQTGIFGLTERHDIVTASAPNGSKDCITNVDVRASDVLKGHRVHVTLDPSRLSGRWCTGVYKGQVEEIQTPVCPQGRPCPTFAILRGTVGRFAFRVDMSGPGGGTGPIGGRGPGTSPGGDTTPPSFAGLERAFACTPGPQRPDETTPYTLSWRAASDDQTSSAELIYDVFYATKSGGEDFDRPSWTTPAGATSFRTPGLPSHGVAYFVVRARDRAGNEDHNTVERQGVDPCL
jgi:hypothetical protein